MKRYLVVILAVVFSFYMFGCAKKEAATELGPEAMSMEALTEVKPQATQATPAMASSALEPFPPAGSYKPTTLEIQIALRNAGFYTSTVDGKKGPLTKKAVEEFQKANGLQPDGRVGLKTWGLLSVHLGEPKAKKKR